MEMLKCLFLVTKLSTTFHFMQNFMRKTNMYLELGSDKPFKSYVNLSDLIAKTVQEWRVMISEPCNMTEYRTLQKLVIYYEYE